MNNKNNDYFEIEKIGMDELEKIAKDQKAFLIRCDIISAVFITLTLSVSAIKGYNPFEFFVKLYMLPLTGLVYSHLKSLSILKKKRQEIQKRENIVDEDTLNGGKTR